MSPQPAFLALTGIALATLLAGPVRADNQNPGRCGTLQGFDADGKPGLLCPLEHTDVSAHIAGFLGRVSVTQRFRNPSDEKIEAIYVFPLPADAAVDRMIMTIGDRRVVGTVKEREEARRIYEQARADGHVASLLDQERPNIFTQAVANIEPGAVVEIEISYVETVTYEDGRFEWSFPMVVGPRYIPGGGTAPAPMTTGNDTPQVPDGSRITPPIAPPGTRAGHDISVEVVIAGGALPITNVASTLHQVRTELRRDGAQVVTLANRREIPNKDFILHYALGGNGLGNAVLTHQDVRGSFLSLILQPPARVEPATLMPRELIFVLDTSGSMSGFPIEKSKEVVARLIDTMQPGDTFNLITFAGNTRILWEGPRPNTPQNRQAAQEFLLQQRGGGGTEMMKAIRTALRQREPQVAAGGPKPIRVVCFLTDGYVGNDMAIIDEVGRNADTTRVFSFGVGNSVNRFLMDGMAHAGRGAVEYVSLASQGDAAVKRFHQRILAPVLTDVRIDWGNLPVSEVYPRRIPDVFSSTPIVVHARLNGPLSGSIRLQGNTGAGAYSQEINLSAGALTANDSLASLWARAKVADLMQRDLAAVQRGKFPEALKKQVIDLGTGYQLVTQFTSFVAVEERIITRDGKPVTVQVPVELPEGVSPEGIFGDGGLQPPRMAGAAGGLRSAKARMSPAPALPPGWSGDTRNRAGQIRRVPPPVQAGEETERDEVSKLAPALRTLAEKVTREGVNGNLKTQNLTVTTWRLNVRITCDELTDAQRQQLVALGFLFKSQVGDDPTWIGSLDVRKLHDAAALDFVRRIDPA